MIWSMSQIVISFYRVVYNRMIAYKTIMPKVNQFSP